MELAATMPKLLGFHGSLTHHQALRRRIIEQAVALRVELAEEGLLAAFLFQFALRRAAGGGKSRERVVPAA